jgi:hypothetical protein
MNDTVIPDVIMSARPDGGWRVELNSDTLPRVLVNRKYIADVTKTSASKADKAFLAEKLQSANWLVKALHQRAERHQWNPLPGRHQKFIGPTDAELHRTGRDFLARDRIRPALVDRHVEADLAIVALD